MIRQYDGIPVVTPAEFDFNIIEEAKRLARPRGNPRTKHVTYFKDLVTAFDIETSGLQDIEQSIMYVWQWAFEEKCIVVGRTWDEFLDFTMELKNHLGDLWLCVYVHNLSYEFSFLKGVYKFDDSEVFAMDARKVLKCTMFQHIEFRCSYIHSNMNLETYTSKMMVKHQKLKGDLDYSVTRYPWTALTDQEWAYCLNDVLGLVEAIRTEMAHDGDNLYTIPLTSTGYVRRDAKKAMRKVTHFFVEEQLPDYRLYQMLREAFRGGNTHANRYWAGKVLPGSRALTDPAHTQTVNATGRSLSARSITPARYRLTRSETRSSTGAKLYLCVLRYGALSLKIHTGAARIYREINAATLLAACMTTGGS